MLVGVFVVGAQEAASEFPVGEIVEGISCQNDPSQTYSLYLPSNYRPDRYWPALVIFDPRGRSVSAAELFREAAEEYGWIVLSSNDTRSDGPMEPNMKAINALWPEVHVRFPTDYDRIYLAGFSGGAMLAWQVGFQTKEVAGVIGAGGRFEPINFDQKLEFPSFGAVGDLDFNYAEMHQVHQQLRKWGTEERLEVFPGPHSWMPKEMATQAIEWQELVAMRRGHRKVDLTLIQRWFEEEIVGVEALPEEDLVTRSLALERLERDFSQWIDTRQLQEQLKTLKTDPQLAKKKKQKEREDGFEEEHEYRLTDAYTAMRFQVPPPTAVEFARQLGLSELQKRATRKGYEGVVAQRLLESVFTQASFYLMRDFFGREDFLRAVSSLKVASQIHPERGYVWYQLACAQARGGRRKAALGSLEQAVSLGFSRRPLYETDTDLDSLRENERFVALLGSLPTE